MGREMDTDRRINVMSDVKGRHFIRIVCRNDLDAVKDASEEVNR